MKKRILLNLSVSGLLVPFIAVSCTSQQKPISNNPVEAYKQTHADVLNKTETTVKVTDEQKVTSALTAYEGLTADVKTSLTSQKTLLDLLNTKISQLKQQNSEGQNNQDPKLPPLSAAEISALISTDDLSSLGTLYFIIEQEASNGLRIPQRVSDFSQISMSQALNSNSGFEAKDPRIGARLLNVRLSEDKSHLVAYVQFGNDQTKQFKLTGFASENGYGGQRLETDDEKSARLNRETNYAVNKSNSEKYDYDLENIKRSLESNALARTFSTTEEAKAAYNKIAKELNMPDYDTASKFGFIIPKYDANGQVVGLDVPTRGPRSVVHWYDHYKTSAPSPQRNTGLARKLINDNYAEAALQSYLLTFRAPIFTNDESVQIALENALGEVEFDIYSMVNLLDDQNAKNEIKARLDADKANNIDGKNTPAVVNAVFNDIINRLQITAGSQAAIEEMWEKKYTPFIKEHWKKLYDAAKKKGIFSQDILNRLKNDINERTVRDYETFVNYKQRSKAKVGNAGTAWILDYEKKEGEEYPTKWYFATNYHVINGWNENTVDTIRMDILNRTNEKHIFNAIKVLSIEEKFNKINVNKSAFKRIFDARDVLTTSPYEISKDQSVKDKEEFIDFAVFEIDFSKFTTNDLDGKTPQEFAKYFTNNYANLEEKLKLKVPTYDYVNNFDKINQPLLAKPGSPEATKQYDNLYVVSYPKARQQGFEDFYLNEHTDADQKAVLASTHTMWTNASSTWYDVTQYNKNDEKTLKQLQKGGTLSHMLNLRQFKDKPGVYDNFLVAPRSSGDKFLESSDDKKEYVNSGIGMLLKNFEVGGGASGSAIRNQNNEIMGILTTVFQHSTTSAGVALRSNGYDYKGLFGTYNLPQYDLIHGGGKDQKVGNSYREKLKTMYGENFKTNLMPNSVKDVPETYKFKQGS